MSAADMSAPTDELEAALDSHYPMPNSPHASVVGHAASNRSAFERGWNAARAAAPVSASLQLTSEQIAAKWKEEWSKLGLRADLPDAFLNLARALIVNAAPVSGPSDEGPDFTVDDADLDALLNLAADMAKGIGNMDSGMLFMDILAKVESRLLPAAPVSGQGARLPPLPKAKEYIWEGLNGQTNLDGKGRSISTNTGPHPNWKVDAIYTGDQMRAYGQLCIDSHPRSEDSPEWNGSNHAEMIQASKDFANGWKSALARNEDNRADALSRALYVIYPAIERDDLRTIIEAALVSNGYDEPLASATPPKADNAN